MNINTALFLFFNIFTFFNLQTTVGQQVDAIQHSDNLYQAQPVIVSPVKRTLNNITRPDIHQLDIPLADVKQVIQSWQKSIRKQTKNKIIKQNGELSIQNTRLDRITLEPINIHSRISATKNGVIIHVLFMTDSTTIVTQENPDLYHACQNFLHDFGVSEYRKAVENDIKNEKKALKKLHSEHKKLRKNYKNYRKKIAKAKSNIETSEINIKTNITDQKTQNKTISNIKSRSFSDEKEKRKALSQEKKAKKKLQRENKSFHKTISKKDALIQKTEANIDTDQIKIEKITRRINLQTLHISNLKSKLSTIK